MCYQNMLLMSYNNLINVHRVTIIWHCRGYCRLISEEDMNMSCCPGVYNRLKEAAVGQYEYWVHKKAQCVHILHLEVTFSVVLTTFYLTDEVTCLSFQLHCALNRSSIKICGCIWFIFCSLYLWRIQWRRGQHSLLSHIHDTTDGYVCQVNNIQGVLISFQGLTDFWLNSDSTMFQSLLGQDYGD